MIDDAARPPSPPSLPTHLVFRSEDFGGWLGIRLEGDGALKGE